ncbi:MAG: 30S ribosomal protein S15 [Candidatus Pacebacteria bacterium]|nr:30S ribosomal protein S15 [Candidatus Paceibacterota bacterium]
MLTTQEKEKIIGDFKINKTDSGSADVQIAILSQEITRLLEHLKANHNDNHSRRGLLKMIIKRKKLLKYLEREDKKRFNSVVKKLGLKEHATK